MNPVIGPALAAVVIVLGIDAITWTAIRNTKDGPTVAQVRANPEPAAERPSYELEPIPETGKADPRTGLDG